MQRLMRATVVVLLTVTLFLYPLLAPPPHRIDEAHFQLITEGMTEAEVKAIFGVPAGSYDWARPKMEAIYVLALAKADLEILAHFERLSKGHETQRWLSRRGAFAVSFDEHGRVVGKRHIGSTQVEFPWQGWWRKLTRK